MALTGRKLCKLDAICAKLKQINQEPGQKPNDNDSVVRENGSHFEAQEEPADLSFKHKKCLNNNIIEDSSIHKGDKEAGDAQDLTVLKLKTKETDTVVQDSRGWSGKTNKSSTDNNTQQSSAKEKNSTEGGPSSGSSIKTGSKLPHVGSSRRKSRKASTPRNIAQIQKTFDHYNHVDEKDELAEYEINNQNTNFPPEDADEDVEKNSFNSSRESVRCDDESLLDSSQTSKELDQSSGDLIIPSVKYETNNGAPLDLSISKTDEASTKNGDLSSDDEDSTRHNLVIDESDYEKTNSSWNESSFSQSTESRKDFGDHKAHAAHLKDYAESTMNELISMYGFSGAQLSADISHQISMPNYDGFLQQVNGLIHMKKEPVESTSASTASSGSQPLMNGDDVGSHDRSQPIQGIFTNSLTQSPTSSVLKVEGKPLS